MQLFKQEFEDIKKSSNPETINEFLIKLSKSPNIEYFSMLDYFIDEIDTQIFEKVKLNLVFLIGEIGKASVIDTKYLEFLPKTYYSSDRWVRDEVVQSIGKISKKTVIGKKLIKLLGYAINDDYIPIRINALRSILDLEKLPLFVWRNIFLALNSNNSELEAISTKILEKFLPDFNQVLNPLNHLDNYKILKPNAIRALLLIYFRSSINLESFRESIKTSNWDIKYKDIFIKEIDTFGKILLKRL